MNLGCAPAGDPAWFDKAWMLLANVKDADRDTAWSEYCSGVAQLWVTTDGERVEAACMTQTCGPDLHVWLCAGKGDWPALMERIATAASTQFKRLTIEGRRGWLRILPGFREENGEFVRDLNAGSTLAEAA